MCTECISKYIHVEPKNVCCCCCVVSNEKVGEHMRYEFASLTYAHRAAHRCKLCADVPVQRDSVHMTYHISFHSSSLILIVEIM